jgi:hypothetical protein
MVCPLMTQSGHRNRSYQNNGARVMNDREEAMSEIGPEMQPTKLRRSEQRAIILWRLAVSWVREQQPWAGCVGLID